MDNKVCICKCRDYSEEKVENTIARIFETLNADKVIDFTHKNVTVKVNLLSPDSPEKAVTVHPTVVEAVCRRLISEGARVTIADSPAGPYSVAVLKRLYAVCGMDRAAERSGAKLNYEVGHRHVDNPDGKLGREFDLITPVVEADMVVSLCKLKTHGLTYFTGAVKNLFGAIPGLEKAGIHSKYSDKFDFCSYLVDLCQLIRPVISITDGVLGMEGAGPSGGSPKIAGLIGGSLNPYALDMAMGDAVMLNPKLMPVLTEAVRRGLCPRDISEIVNVGDRIDGERVHFLPASSAKSSGSSYAFFSKQLIPRKWREKYRGIGTPWPVMTERCVGCGKCAEICPRQTITMTGRRASPDYQHCIRCYCCHEVCPVQAIDLVKGRTKRT